MSGCLVAPLGSSPAGLVMNASICMPSKLGKVNDSVAPSVRLARSAAFNVVIGIAASEPFRTKSSAGAVAVDSAYATTFAFERDAIDHDPTDPASSTTRAALPPAAGIR